MEYEIISIKDSPQYRDMAVDWFASKWGIPHAAYEKSFDECLNGDAAVPQWFFVFERGNDSRIIAGCGIIENDFTSRTDLSPYLCALYVEKFARGNRIGSALLHYARNFAHSRRISKLYLCTNHTSYYEQYGWRYIGDDEESRIYEADTDTGSAAGSGA